MEPIVQEEPQTSILMAGVLPTVSSSYHSKSHDNTYDWSFQSFVLNSRENNSFFSFRNPYSLLISKSAFESSQSPSNSGFNTHPLSSGAKEGDNAGFSTTKGIDKSDQSLVSRSHFAPASIAGNYVSIAATKHRLLLLDRIGDVYQWVPALRNSRNNTDGDPWIVDNKPSLLHALTLERALSGIRVKSISCGPDHCLALTEAPNFDVYSWGIGRNGRLGHGSEGTEVSPRVISTLIPYRVTCISAGFQHNAAITMGYVGSYAIETAEYAAAQVRERREGKSKSKRAGSLSLRYELQLAQQAIQRNRRMKAGDQSLGAVWTWGCGEFGALGRGSEDDSYEPQRVHGILKVSALRMQGAQSGPAHSHGNRSVNGDSASFSGSVNYGHTKPNPSNLYASSSISLQGPVHSSSSSSNSLNAWGATAPIRDDVSDSDSVHTRATGVSMAIPSYQAGGASVSHHRGRSGGVPSSTAPSRSRFSLSIFGSSGSSGVPTDQQLRTEEYALYRTGLYSSDSEPPSIPKVGAPRGQAVQLSCGNQFTVVVTADGDVWTWGRADRGQTGLELEVLLRQSRLERAANREQMVTFSRTRSAEMNSTVSSFGSNSNSSINYESSESGILCVLRPHRVPFPPLQYRMDEKAVLKAARYHLEKARSSSSSIEGLLMLDQLFNGHKEHDELAPDAAAAVDDISNIQLYYWAEGTHRYGLDGLADATLCADCVRASSLAVGDAHAVLLARDGSVWSWGDNSAGQVGAGKFLTSVARPVQIPVHLFNAARKEELAGSSEVLLVGSDPKQPLYSTINGYLKGLSESSSMNSPINTSGVGRVDPPVRVFAGPDYSIVKTLGGTLAAWGANVAGQLGMGPAPPSSSSKSGSLNSSFTEDGAAPEFDRAVGGADVTSPDLVRISDGIGRTIVDIACSKHLVVCILSESNKLESIKQDPTTPAVTAEVDDVDIGTTTEQAQKCTCLPSCSAQKPSLSSPELALVDESKGGELSTIEEDSQLEERSLNASTTPGGVPEPCVCGCENCGSIPVELVNEEEDFSNLLNSLDEDHLTPVDSDEETNDEPPAQHPSVSVASPTVMSVNQSPSAVYTPDNDTGVSRRARWSASVPLAQSIDSAPSATPGGLTSSAHVPLRASRRRSVAQEGILSEEGLGDLALQVDLRASKRVIEALKTEAQRNEWSTLLAAVTPLPGPAAPFLTANGSLSARGLKAGVSVPALARGGIPHDLRAAVYSLALGNAARVTPALLQSLLEAVAASDAQRKLGIPRSTDQFVHDDELIEMDLLRTFSGLNLFGPPDSHSHGPLYATARDTLRAFVRFRPDVGYVQGMSYIAAMLCLVCAGQSVAHLPQLLGAGSATAVVAGRGSSRFDANGEIISFDVTDHFFSGYFSNAYAVAPVPTSSTQEDSAPVPEGSEPQEKTPEADSLTAKSVALAGGAAATPLESSAPVSVSTDVTGPHLPSPVPVRSPQPSFRLSLKRELSASPFASSPNSAVTNSISNASSTISLPTVTASSPVNLNPSLRPPSDPASSSTTNLATAAPSVIRAVANTVGSVSSTGSLGSPTTALQPLVSPQFGAQAPRLQPLGPPCLVPFTLLSAFLFSPTHLYTFLSLSQPAIRPFIQLFEQCLSSARPAVAARLRAEHIDTSMFLFPWLQTLFLKSLPVPMALRVIDGFVFHGTVYLFKVSVALLDVLLGQFLSESAEFEEIVAVLTRARASYDDKTENLRYYYYSSFPPQKKQQLDVADLNAIVDKSDSKGSSSVTSRVAKSAESLSNSLINLSVNIDESNFDIAGSSGNDANSARGGGSFLEASVNGTMNSSLNADLEANDAPASNLLNLEARRIWSGVTDVSEFFKIVDSIEFPVHLAAAVEELTSDPFFYRHVEE